MKMKDSQGKTKNIKSLDKISQGGCVKIERFRFLRVRLNTW